MAELSDNQKKIEEVISTAFSQNTIVNAYDIIGNLLQIIKNYLLQLDNFYLKLEQAAKVIPEFQIMQADDLTIRYELFKKLTYEEEQITRILKDGYIIIERIREFFTKETISYVIGTVYRGKLYEKTMSMEDILQNVSANYNTRSSIDNLFKLRFSFKNKGQFVKIAGEAQAKIEKNVQQGSSVFSAVWRYIHSQQKSHGKKVNKGNAYETYKVIVESRKNNNIKPYNIIPPPVDQEEISRVFEEVKKNITPFRQGGDLLNQQYKFFSSAPSLMTTATARNDLTTLATYFEHFLFSKNSQQLFNNLKDFFTKDPSFSTVADRIERDSILQAQENLKQTFDKMGLTIYI